MPVVTDLNKFVDAAADCPGPPVVSRLSSGAAFRCGTLRIEGENLRCPNTVVRLLGVDAEIVAGATGQPTAAVRIR